MLVGCLVSERVKLLNATSCHFADSSSSLCKNCTLELSCWSKMRGHPGRFFILTFANKIDGCAQKWRNCDHIFCVGSLAPFSSVFWCAPRRPNQWTAMDKMPHNPAAFDCSTAAASCRLHVERLRLFHSPASVDTSFASLLLLHPSAIHCANRQWLRINQLMRATGYNVGGWNRDVFIFTAKKYHASLGASNPKERSFHIPDFSISTRHLQCSHLPRNYIWFTRSTQIKIDTFLVKWWRVLEIGRGHLVIVQKTTRTLVWVPTRRFEFK